MANSSLADHTIIVMGQSPAGEACNMDGVGLPLLNGPTEYGPHHPTPVQFTTDPRKRARQGDVLFCVRGSTTGRMNWADQEYAIGRGIAAIRHRSGCELQPLVRAVIEFGLPDLLAQATGSTFPNVSSDQLGKLWWPPLPEEQQLSIAHILGRLDDKIELNRRLDETLEAMARALFRSWFVDFDPVRAKAEGYDPGLPVAIAALFPNDFEDSQLGEIPEGWATSPVFDIATFINGAAYRDFEPNQKREGLPVIKIAELKEGITAQTGFSTVEMPEKYRINTRDILFSWSGNPDTSIDTFVWSHGSAWLNQHIFRVVPPSEDARAFVLMMLRYLRPVFAETARNKHTTGLGHVTAADLKRLHVVRPPRPVLLAWNAIVEALLERSFGLQRENDTLASLRDILLSKLILGELRVKDAEKRVEALV
jgi:type I restriction enzyme, S subunit